MNRNLPRQLGALLVLGRTSGLPAIWSGCVAGWWLGGGGNFGELGWLLGSLSAIYLGGAFLNDAWDAEYDRQLNFKRPIPSGAITQRDVLRWAWAWLMVGGLSLFAIGLTAGTLGLALIVAIVAYNATHRVITISPWLLGVCRFFVYPIAASTGESGISGLTIWFGVMSGIFMAGVGFFARGKNLREEIPQWPLALLVFPIFFALLANADAYRQMAVVASLFLMAWMLVCLRPIFQSGNGNKRHAHAGLFAGIILADWLAVMPLHPKETSIACGVLFGMALLAQRFSRR